MAAVVIANSSDRHHLFETCTSEAVPPSHGRQVLLRLVVPLLLSSYIRFVWPFVTYFTCSQKLRISTERFSFSPDPEAVQQAGTWTRVLVVPHADAEAPAGGNGMYCCAAKSDLVLLYFFIFFQQRSSIGICGIRQTGAVKTAKPDEAPAPTCYCCCCCCVCLLPTVASERTVPPVLCE